MFVEMLGAIDRVCMEICLHVCVDGGCPNGELLRTRLLLVMAMPVAALLALAVVLMVLLLLL